tara:strand:- start:5857 stop:6756 length:900 start_codon:yes stop_codon:yes gene_type:complete
MYNLAKFLWISFFSIMAFTAAHAGESELEKLKTSFTNKINTVLSPLINRHKNSLESLEKNLANVSQIEAALLVREERLRISKAVGINLIGEIPESPDKLRTLCQRFNREAASSIRVWEKKYEQTLILLESRLTKSGKLNDALLVKNEIIKFKRVIDLRDNKNDNEEKLLDYALATKGAVAKAYKGAEFLIDGNLDYSGSDGFAWGLCPSDFEIVFPKVTKIQEINFLLYDKDKSREYLYQLFVMRKEEGEWELIADHSKKPSKGWQKHKFSLAGIKSIKVKGIFNSANRNFQIVEVEAR